jgi:tyrosinase
MPSKFRQRKITPTIINYLYEKDASIVGDNTKPRGYNINRNYPLTHLDVTTGGPGAIEFGYDAAFSYTNFHKFQNAIEKPHNNIHIKIGGTYMPSQNYAAYDPIFYTHHANIDRLWQNWLKLGKGRCNPNEEDDKEWMNTVFNFYDEYGKPVSLTVKDILTIAPQLNYVYDDYTKEEDYLPKEECDKSYKNCESFPYAKGSSKIIKIVLPKYIIQAKISTSKEANSIVLGDEKMFKNGKIYINDTENSDMVFLEFDKIDILQKPEAAIEIYINPKDINKLFPSNLSYAGTVNLFSTGQNEFKHHSNTKDVIIINDVIKKLNLDVEQLKKVKLVFVVRGNFIDGNEVTTTTNVIINEAAIIVYKKSP